MRDFEKVSNSVRRFADGYDGDWAEWEVKVGGGAGCNESGSEVHLTQEAAWGVVG